MTSQSKNVAAQVQVLLSWNGHSEPPRKAVHSFVKRNGRPSFLVRTSARVERSVAERSLEQLAVAPLNSEGQAARRSRTRERPWRLTAQPR